MADYIKSTNFAVKDALTSGNPSKVVKGTEIDTEFNNIAAAVASKADSQSPTFTGTPLAPTAGAGTNTTQIATTAFVGSAITTAIGNINTGVVTFSGGTTGLTPNTATAGAVTLGGTLALTNGGTGGATASDARTNLGLGALATLSTVGSSQISSSAVGTSQLANSSVTGAKLSGGQSGTAPVYGARAWVNFDGTIASPSIRASGNVSSVTKNGTGDYTVNFSTSMSDTNYCLIATTDGTGNNHPVRSASLAPAPYTPATSSVRVSVGLDGASTTVGRYEDSVRVFVAVIR